MVYDARIYSHAKFGIKNICARTNEKDKKKAIPAPPQKKYFYTIDSTIFVFSLSLIHICLYSHIILI